eukprot:m.333175 g.333175  ORF g.333175 m.333175 type:complete len:1993 (+) comp20502_c0_seq7:93-6071(+)
MFSPGAILSSVYGSYADVRQVMTPVHNERRRLHPMGGRDQALHIAKKYVERREYENAMQELETHDLATSAEGCELLGLCFRHRGDTKRALKHFRQALQLDSKRMVNQLYVAEELVGLVANGHTDVTAVADAQDALKTAAELFPGDPRIFALRKEMYSAQGDRASIEALIQQEIDSDPMSAKGYILQADHLISVGNVVNAWQLCKETSMCLAHSAEWSEQSVDLLDRIVKANVIPAEKSHLALLNAIVGVLHRHIRSRDGKEITAKYLLKLEDGIAAASVAWGKLSTNTCRADRCAECLKEFRAQQIAYCGLFLLHHVDHTPASDERMRCAILCHMISFDQGFVSLDKVKESGVDDDDVNAMASMSRSRVYESEQILRRALAVQQEDCLDQVLAVGLSRLGDVLKRWMLCTNATLEVAIPVSGAAIRHSLSVNAPQDIAHSSASIVTENIANLDFLVMACASAIMYRSNPSSLLRGVINAFSGYLPLHESGARSLDKLRCDDAAAFVWALAWKRIYAMDRNTGAHSSGRDGTRSTEPSRPDFFDHLSYVTPDCYMTPLQQRFWATVLQAGTAYMGETINGVRTLTLHESIDYLQQLRRANALEQPESTAYMPVQLLIALGDWFGSCAVAVVADDNFAGVPPAESFRLAKSLRSRTVVYYANADAVGSNAMKHATIPLDRAMSPAAARVNASGATRFGRTSFMSGTPSRLRHAISRPTGRSGAPSERRETRNILLDLDAADYGRHGEFAELLKSCLTPYADALLSLQRHHEALAILSRIGTAVACKRSADLRMQLLREFVDTRLTPTTQKRPSEGELRSFLAMQADAYREYARCISGSATDDADGSFAMTTWSAEEEREINAHMDELCTTLRSALCAALGHGGGNGMATPPGNGNGLNASLVTLRSFPSTPIPKTPGAATAIPALHPVSASKFKDAQSRILDRLKGTQNSASPKPSPLHAQATSTPVAHQAPSTHNSNISESSPNDAQAVSDVMSFFIELGIPPMLVTLAEKLGADSRADFAGLNEDDLKEVGFKPVHRRKILGHFHAATSPQEPLAATGANDSNLSIILDQIKDHLARTHQESPAAAVKLQSSAHGSPFLLRDTECTVIHNTAEGVTDTERKDARELQLPENFYTYTRVYPRTEYRQQIPVETIDSIIEKLPAFSCSSVDAPRFGMENSLSSSPLRSQQSVDRSTSLILGDTTGLNDQRDTIGAPSTATPANATSIPEFRIGSNTGRDGLSLSSLPSGTGRNSASSVSNSAAGGTVMNAGGGFSFASGGSGGFTFGSGLAGKTASGGTETAKPSAASDDKGTDKKGPGLFAGLDLTGSTASSSSTGSTLFGGSGGLFGAKSNEGSTTEGGSGSAMSPSSSGVPLFSSGLSSTGGFAGVATSTDGGGFGSTSGGGTYVSAFANAGAPVFGGKKGSPGKASGADGESGDPDAENDAIHYEPIVKLEAMQEAKTGEEDETERLKLRCKLYRWGEGNEGMQWKERGLGDIKILTNPTTGNSRLVMRREQVLKVVANQMIVPDIKLMPMKDSKKQLCWASVDGTDDETTERGVIYKFLIKFKTEDFVGEFKKTFEACQAEYRKDAAAPAAGRGDVSAASEAATSTSPTAASPKSVSLDLTGAAAADKGDNSGGTVGTVTLERDSVTSLFSDGHDTNPGAALTGNSVSSSGSSGSKSVPGAAAGGATFNFSFGMDKVPSPKSFIQGGAGAFSVGAGLFNNVSSLSPPGQLFGNTPPPVTAAAAGGDDGGGAFSPGGLFGGGATFSPSAKPFSPATLSAHLGSAGPSPSSAPLDPQQDSNENSANGDETDDGEDDYENYNEGEEVEDYGKEFDGETDDPDAYFAGYANYDDGTLAAGSPSDDYSGSLGEVPENLSIGSPVHNDDGGDDLDASALLQLAQSAPPHTFAVPRAPARSGDEGGGAGDGFSGATSGADTTGKPRRIAKGRRKKNLQPAMVPATSMAALQQYDDDVGTDGGWSTCSDSDTGADVA